jgi:hypothetical protein
MKEITREKACDLHNTGKEPRMFALNNVIFSKFFSLEDGTAVLQAVPAGFTSSPEAGIISNTSFLLHVSEKVWEEIVLPALRVRAAFENSDKGYLERTLTQRQPGKGGAGSRFKRETSLEEVKNAGWVPYTHPAVVAPATAFRAPLAGTVGLIRLDSLQPDTEVVLRDGHSTDFVEACVPGGQGPEVDFTVVLLGPDRETGKEVVWTFFPGEPIGPSKIPAAGNDGRRLTALEAIGLGLEWAKAE